MLGYRSARQFLLASALYASCPDVAGKKQSCPHIDAWPGAEPGMTSQAFEEHIQQFIDPNTGARKLTCTSRADIPEDLRKGARATDWAGAHMLVLWA